MSSSILSRQIINGSKTQIALSNNNITNIQNVSSYDSIELNGWVDINATIKYRFSFKSIVTKKGDGSDYLISPQISGDAPPDGFDINVTTSGIVQITLPNISGFASASTQFGLSGATIGISLPLQIESTRISFSNIQAKDTTGFIFQNSSGTTVGSTNNFGYWFKPQQPIISGQIGTAMTNPAASQKIAFNEFWVNRGITYDSVNRRFYVPVAGVYRISMNPFFKTGVTARRLLVGINTDTPTITNHYGHAYSENAEYETACINSVVSLNANDYIVFYLSSGELYNQSSDKFNQFSIELIG